MWQPYVHLSVLTKKSEKVLKTLNKNEYQSIFKRVKKAIMRLEEMQTRLSYCSLNGDLIKQEKLKERKLRKFS